MNSLAVQSAAGAMELASASAAQSVQMATLRTQLDTDKLQASLLLDTFDKMNDSINTKMVRSIRPHLGTNVDLYI